MALRAMCKYYGILTKGQHVTLRDVRYAPQATLCLIWVGRLTNDNMMVLFEKGKRAAEITNPGWSNMQRPRPIHSPWQPFTSPFHIPHLLLGDNLLFTPKVSQSFSNSDLWHLQSSPNSDLPPVPETLWSSSYSEPLPAISNAAMCPFHPNTSANTSSEGSSKTPTSSEGNSDTSSNSAPSNPTSAPMSLDALGVGVEMEWLLWHPILRVALLG